MKRSGPIARRTPLKRSTKRIPEINIARAARRRDKTALDRRSPEWRALRKAALKRAGGRCEYTQEDYWRCPATEHLQVHHLRYTKVRAETSLSDLQVLCLFHHEHIESTRYTYRAHRRLALARAERRA